MLTLASTVLGQIEHLLIEGVILLFVRIEPFNFQLRLHWRLVSRCWLHFDDLYEERVQPQCARGQKFYTHHHYIEATTLSKGASASLQQHLYSAYCTRALNMSCSIHVLMCISSILREQSSNQAAAIFTSILIADEKLQTSKWDFCEIGL